MATTKKTVYKIKFVQTGYDRWSSTELTINKRFNELWQALAHVRSLGYKCKMLDYYVPLFERENIVLVSSIKVAQGVSEAFIFKEFLC